MHYGKLITGCLVLTIAFSCSRPIAQFAIEGEKQVLQNIQFDNQSEKATQYEWDFGDGNQSDSESPAHKYKSSGSYTIQLKAINEKGKSKITKKEITVAPPKACLVELETRYGNMIIQLYDSTPKHQDNFIKLVEEEFYDSLLFHRVIQNFMIQGGDPQSKNAAAAKSLGSGGPGYTVEAEFVDENIHVKGALAAARTSDAVNPQKRSSGSQYYIVQGQPIKENQLKRIEAQKNIRYTADQREKYLTHGGTPFLDREYTVFGQVIDGLEVIDKIATSATNDRDRPNEDIIMIIRLIR